MIFAAGLGSRLVPYTNTTPKALVEVNGKPLIWYALNNVIQAGATRIVVNVHHFADQVIQYLSSDEFSSIDIKISHEKDELLETGGGLIKASSLFLPDEPIIIHNSDVLTNADLNEMVNHHKKENPLATLMVEDRSTSRYFLFDKKSHLGGWLNKDSGEKVLVSDSIELTEMAFDGVQIVNFEILKMLGDERKFSITKAYIELAKKQTILGWKNWKGQWFDVGTPEKHSIASENYKYPRIN